MNRREFLAASAATVTLPLLGKDKPAMIPIVDTHEHLWDLAKFKLGWIKEKDDSNPLAKSHTPKEYAAAIDGLNIVKSVYMEVDVVPEQQQAEADYVLDIIKSKATTMVAAVISGRPASDGFKKYVEQYKDVPAIKGVRQVIHVDDTPGGYCLKKEFVAGVRLLGELGKSFDICIRPGDLPDADKLIGECPGTRFILDHCGNAPILDAKKMEQWKKDISKLAGRKNVVGKVSGIIASVKKGDWSPDTLAPAVNHTIEAFGWDRVMFASDWPVCTTRASLKEWVEALKAIVKDRTEEQRTKLFHNNAVKFYGL